jgi:hypothetical protein
VSSTSESVKVKIPLNPKNPERICWGCDKYCPAKDLRCGNGTIRTPHPAELFGEDWMEWELGHATPEAETSADRR